MSSKAISAVQLEELKEHGFVVIPQVFDDLVPEVIDHTGAQFEAIQNSGIDFSALMLDRAKHDPIMRHTGAHAPLTISDELPDPRFDGWYMEWSGNRSLDIRTKMSDYPKSAGTPIGRLIERVHAAIDPLDALNESKLQVRWMAPSSGEVPSAQRLYDFLGFHCDGAGTFQQTADLSLLPVFKYLLGAYLTDMDSDYFERPSGQLVVLDGGHRVATRLFKQLRERLDEGTTREQTFELYGELFAKPLHRYCKENRNELVTVRVKPGDLMVAHGLLPHAPGALYFADPANKPSGRTAIYFRVGEFTPEERQGEALTDPDFVWKDLLID